MSESSASGQRERAMNELSTQVLRGADAILREKDLLREIAAGCGQDEIVADIHYYLDKPGLLSRTPVLLVMRHAGASQDYVAAAILLFEYKLAGIPLGMYTSNDRSGRRTVIGRAEKRLDMAIRASEHLLREGANIVLLSLRTAQPRQEMLPDQSDPRTKVLWRFRQREVADYLPLCPTFDGTLAHIGKRTRTHMRYYRRRAEVELGCTFHPELEIDERELVAFNSKCMYPVRQNVAAWRLRALRQFDRPILMGLRDEQGELLSVLGGRRFGNDSDVLWQMNRGGLDRHSLSLVMRTYFIEHEISRGIKRVYLDGGSSHSLSHSFARGTVTDFAALRRTPLSFFVRMIARPLIPPDNELGHLLAREMKSTSPEPSLRTE